MSDTPETDSLLRGDDTRWSVNMVELRDLCRKLERERNEAHEAEVALAGVAQLLAEIMRDQVNHQDEAEKWLRAYAPQHLSSPNNETTKP